jgi:pimeloyl-ACP methyl ester carboxylesterase
VLNIDGVGVHDNFFSLGGHSLLLLKLVRRLEEVFSLKLGVTKIMANQTIDQQALLFVESSRRGGQSISSASQNEPRWEQIDINLSFCGKGDEERSVVFVPGGGGGVEQFQYVTDILRRSGRAAYVIHHDGVTNGEQPLDTIEAMVDGYRPQLAKHVDSPSVFCGYCLGAWVGYEMLRTSGNAGGKIRDLVAIETAPPQLSLPPVWAIDRYRYLFFRAILSRHFGAWRLNDHPDFTAMSDEKCLAYVAQDMDERDIANISLLWNCERAHYVAGHRYYERLIERGAVHRALGSNQLYSLIRASSDEDIRKQKKQWVDLGFEKPIMKRISAQYHVEVLSENADLIAATIRSAN